MPKVKAPHHRGSYHRRSAEVRALAYSQPDTRCWVCGLTLAEIRVRNPRAKWTAGHIRDGEVDGMLLPECSVDNYSRGARYGNRRRAKYRPQPPRITDLTW